MDDSLLYESIFHEKHFKSFGGDAENVLTFFKKKNCVTVSTDIYNPYLILMLAFKSWSEKSNTIR